MITVPLLIYYTTVQYEKNSAFLRCQIFQSTAAQIWKVLLHVQITHVHWHTLQKEILCLNEAFFLTFTLRKNESANCISYFDMMRIA